MRKQKVHTVFSSSCGTAIRRGGVEVRRKTNGFTNLFRSESVTVGGTFKLLAVTEKFLIEKPKNLCLTRE